MTGMSEDDFKIRRGMDTDKRLEALERELDALSKMFWRFVTVVVVAAAVVAIVWFNARSGGGCDAECVEMNR